MILDDIERFNAALCQLGIHNGVEVWLEPFDLCALYVGLRRQMPGLEWDYVRGFGMGFQVGGIYFTAKSSAEPKP